MSYRNSLDFRFLMDDGDGSLAACLRGGQEFLAGHTTGELLSRVGTVAEEIPSAPFPDKRWFQKSYGREVNPAPEEFLVGRDLFYLTEQRRLFLDCTSGHYQMTWGYERPELRRLLLEGIEKGITWDNHSNIPAAPVKRLAEKLVRLANPGADLGSLQSDPSRLNTVLLGIVTGTVACAAALKMMLAHYQRDRALAGDPVFVVLEGNYHGTDVLAQRLRGMWPQYFTGLEVVTVQPNDPEELEHAFARWGERVAGFWAEPIMMNREAIRVEPEYLQLARRLCDEQGALLALDEIQTGFWYPEVLYTLRTGIEPDFLILGKGMAAGFHPLSAVVYRGRYDLLEQYDAISTNGNAALAAFLSLGCLALIERHAETIGAQGRSLQQGVEHLATDFPDLLVEARGCGHMSGLKFHRVEDALGFHQACLARGLWLRVHAYHAGHSTVLTKFALTLDQEVIEFALGVWREILAARPWR